MRIGELLVEQRKLRQSDLARALTEKPKDKRIVSFLIARGLVDFDDASRALGEQKGVPSALSKHLAGRDPELATLIPAELGRASCALPIGRTSQGALIVCVRDPAPAVLAQLRQATRGEIIMVIAPANRLEHLVLSSYGAAPTDELDVDFSTTGMGDNPVVNPPSVARAAAKVAKLPPEPDMSALDPASVRLALTDLDDERVDRDPTQSGRMPQITKPPESDPAIIVGRTPTKEGGSEIDIELPPPKMPASLPDNPPIAMGRNRRASTNDPKATRPMSLSAMSVGLEHATTREAATDLVLAYVATRWLTGIVFVVRDKKSAMGFRGHGVSMPDLVSIPLAVPSAVQRAIETKFVVAEDIQSPAQEALVRALDGPAIPAAAPVVVGGQPVAVIVVGNPIDRETTVELAAADLGMLAEALGSAYTRIAAR